MRTLRNILTVICTLILLARSAPAADFRFSPDPNKAHLIHWRAWGPEALEEAKKQDRLVLLSLSAVWCHWCHVMDETTYSNEGIIAFINEHFIPIRVDSDMRPDIDALYNQGGWPSTVIMTPQGELLSGGTYIPPEEMLGRLTRIADIFRNDRTKITGWLEETRTARTLHELASAPTATAGAPGERDLHAIVKDLANSFDKQHGGFGEGQKFPSPESLDLLLARAAGKKNAALGRIVTTTLDHMATGGLFDEVDGGFFRYATRPDWSEPHYEKMLDVNAGMIRNYADASLFFSSSDYKGIVRKCVGYVRKNLYDDASGAFFGSQDAEEAYYRSTKRKGMTAPAVDRTEYADSSSLMISALVSAYDAVGEKQYLAMAKKGADHLLAELFVKDAGVYHFSRNGTRNLDGLLSDNVLAGSALLDLYNATGEKHYLNAAEELDRSIVSRYYDAQTKRFRPSLAAPLAAPIAPGLLAKVNENLANYRALRFLGRMLFIEDSQEQRRVRDEALSALRGSYQDYSPNAAAYGNAVLWAVGDPVEITVIAQGKKASSFLAAIRGVYLPKKVVRVLSTAHDGALIRKLGYPKREAMYFCAGKRCSKPVTDRRKAKEELKRFLEQKEKK
jgi:uncharacterized protein YyaL (SSP411 family)